MFSVRFEAVDYRVTAPRLPFHLLPFHLVAVMSIWSVLLVTEMRE